ncbi:MAG: D-glycero-alpha-D-manno-heptose-1,7-bisphosphate 7-phosphatase [Chloroflexota bacterium]
MRRAVFLDRDGTLIRNHHYGCDPDGIELLEGVHEGLGLLKRAGYLLIVVTNQSGIARGFFTEEQLAAMHRRLGELLEARGVAVDGWYYCPHHPEGVVPEYARVCECRKPAPGMVLRGCADYDVDPAASWLIGDIQDDVEAGKRVGARAILVDMGTEDEPDRPERTPDYVARSFLEAVRHILESESDAGRGLVPRRPGAGVSPALPGEGVRRRG